MEILFFPEKNTPLKRYMSYFPSLRLVVKRIEDIHECPAVVLCHSRGIDSALALTERFPTVKIVAMDPSICPANNPNVYVFVQKAREFSNALNMTTYTEPTHYPYEVRKLRNAIVKCIVKLNDINEAH